MPNAVKERKVEAQSIEDVIKLELEDVAASFMGENVSMHYDDVFKRYLDHLFELHAGYFEGQNEPSGSPWVPLAASTIKKKGHDIILVETGDLAASLTSKGHANNISDIINEGLNQGFAWGTSDWKSPLHQGEGGNGRGVPRPHVGTTEESVNKLTEALADQAVLQITK